MKIKVKKLHPEAKLPVRGTVGAACYDVVCTKKTWIPPGRVELVPTGLAFELPTGVALDIRPRSGLSRSLLVVCNSPGTLDSDYRGELLIPLHNLSGRPRLIEVGDRIAQVRPFKVESMEFEVVEELSTTERGEGGFGSTDESRNSSSH